MGETLEREVDLAVTLMDTEDFAEGIAAFGERRPRPSGAGDNLTLINK